MSEKGTSEKPVDRDVLSTENPQRLRLRKLQNFITNLEKKGGPSTISREVEGPFNLRMKYWCSIKIADAFHLPKRRSCYPRQRRKLGKGKKPAK